MWGDHATTVCTKDATAPATCGLCGGAHPANYRSCDNYRRLQTARGAPHPDRSLPSLAHPPSPSIPTYSTSLPSPTQPLVEQPKPPPAPFSHVVASGTQPVDLAVQLSTFLNEFKSLFTQHMQQTDAILSMLTAVLPRPTT